MSDKRLLTLDDIADGSAYERERDAFRADIIELKKIRRVSVGPVVTFVFENRDTIRFQIQEMARAEKMFTDEAIQMELDTYNPLIPEPGRLAASLFVELTSRHEMEFWLPRLVGIEKTVQVVIGAGTGAEVVSCDVDEAHAANLTREEVTAAVHFVHFRFTSGQVTRFGSEPVAVAIDHSDYSERTALSPATRASLLSDLLG